MRPIRFGHFARGVVAAGLLAAPICAFADSVPSKDGTAGQLVSDHLAAGEFSAAMRVAESADVDERDALISQVFEAEANAGEFDAATLTASRFPQATREAVAEQAATGDLAGGAQGLQELISLVQQTTGGPPYTGWLEIDGTGGTISPFGIGNSNPGGVAVDPLGKMTLLAKADPTGRLREIASSARMADLNADMAKASDLRVVSLTRLEREVAARLERGEPVPTSMRQLAGLTRLQYVFLDEEHNEILVAGPAEGWRYNEAGLPVGSESGQPVLHLDDLVTVLRTFGPQGAKAFQCSIDPRAEGMQAVQEYAANSAARGPLSAGAGVRSFTNRLAQLLGEQDVYVGGVPTDSRVARVIVEADYRMKLIGVDKLQAAGLPSFFDLLSVSPSAEPVATKALRWWLTVNYDAVLHSADKSSFEFVGQAVKCQSEDEFLNAQGERVSTGRAEATNRLFAEQFTRGYEELAAADPVFADLRNVFDLSLAAALIRAEKLDQRAGWDGGVFAAAGAYQPASYMPAETVATVANHRVYNGSEVVVQVAGGVRGDLMSLLKDGSIYRYAIRGGTAAAAKAAAPESRWWWDAK